MIKKVICDCDNTLGVPEKPVDDAQALMYLFGQAEIELLGITTTFGNGSIDEVYRATHHLLNQVNRPEIPLLRGAGQRREGPTEAADFLADMVALHPGEINLLALGPVGNLRAAGRIYSDFFSQLKQIAIMGGITSPIKLGNRDLPELNLASDPEAAYEVFRAPCPITLMNAHICMSAPFSIDDMSRIANWNTWMRTAIKDFLYFLEDINGVAMDYLWDLLPAVYLNEPELFDENTVKVCSRVADLETGMIKVTDEGSSPPINMPSRIVDLERFNAIVDRAWANSPIAG